MSLKIQKPDISTNELADELGIQPTSIRIRLCRTGSYFGLRPTKMPNGRLRWPGDSKERLISGSKDQGGADHE